MAVPKFITNDMKGGYVGGPTTPVRRGYVGSSLVFQDFSPASEQEFIQQEATGGPAQLLKVYGKSVVNNQNCGAGYYLTTFCQEVTVGDIKTYTLTQPGGASRFVAASCAYTTIVGHKYFLYTNAIASFASASLAIDTRVRINGAWISLQHSGAGYAPRIFTCTNAETYNNSSFGFIGGDTGDSVSFSGDYPYKLIDLTLRFGAGSEPTSVDEALRLLGGDAFDPTFDPGSLQSNKTSELRAERIPVINVWDEEWELGAVSVRGSLITDFTRIRPKNYISVTPNSEYYLYCGYLTQGEINVIYYANKGDTSSIGYQPISYNSSKTFTPPANCHYIKFSFENSVGYGNTYRNDICINLSDPAINGQYFPHWRGSLTLNLSTLTSGGVVVFPDGLRGVGDIRDEAYGSTGVVRLGKRAYQTGDESDTSVLTDGTNTIYPLATPLTYTLDTPLPTDLTCVQGDILQRVSDNNCPFVGEMRFGL